MINKNGYVEVPITDPEHLVRIEITADVTSVSNSSWGNAGCAVCINAVDEDGTKFWTSKGYSLSLGKDSFASVEFDGTLINEEAEVDAVVADGKIELQKWWESSEKGVEGETDVVVDYKKIDVVYKYENKDEPTTTAPVVTPTTKPAATATNTVYGDANCDGKISIADATAILQSLGNNDKYGLSSRGTANADVNGKAGVTADDAIVIKNVDAKLISESDLPLKA